MARELSGPELEVIGGTEQYNGWYLQGLGHVSGAGVGGEKQVAFRYQGHQVGKIRLAADVEDLFGERTGKVAAVR